MTEDRDPSLHYCDDTDCDGALFKHEARHHHIEVKIDAIQFLYEYENGDGNDIEALLSPIYEELKDKVK